MIRSNLWRNFTCRKSPVIHLIPLDLPVLFLALSIIPPEISIAQKEDFRNRLNRRSVRIPVPQPISRMAGAEEIGGTSERSLEAARACTTAWRSYVSAAAEKRAATDFWLDPAVKISPPQT
jgi:hypothetical protein